MSKHAPHPFAATAPRASASSAEVTTSSSTSSGLSSHWAMKPRIKAGTSVEFFRGEGELSAAGGDCAAELLVVADGRATGHMFFLATISSRFRTCSQRPLLDIAV